MKLVIEKFTTFYIFTCLNEYKPSNYLLQKTDPLLKLFFDVLVDVNTALLNIKHKNILIRDVSKAKVKNDLIVRYK